MAELLKSMSTPIVWVFVLMLFGVVLRRLPGRRKLPRAGWLFTFGAWLMLYLFSIPPVSDFLVHSLEQRHLTPAADAVSGLDVVVILGGGYYPADAVREFPEPTGPAYSRVVGGVRIFKSSGAKTLALCGRGSHPGPETEADVLKTLAMELAVEESKILTETRSRNTMENATELRKLLAGEENRNIGLVTSAIHIPRAQRVFQKVFPGDVIVPVPVNRIYSPAGGRVRSMTPSAGALQTSTQAIHEWIGMLWYAVRY